MTHARLQEYRIRLVALAAAFVFAVAALQSASFSRLSGSVGYEPIAAGGMTWMASQAPVEAMNTLMMVAPAPSLGMHGAAKHTMLQLDPAGDILVELKELPDGVVGMRVHRAAQDPDPTGFHAAAAEAGWLDVILGVFEAR